MVLHMLKHWCLKYAYSVHHYYSVSHKFVYTKSYVIYTGSNMVWLDKMDHRRTGAILYGYNNKKIRLWTSSVPYPGKKISTHDFIYSVSYFYILLVAKTLGAGQQRLLILLACC